jgi:hypothetical protein
MSKMRNVLIVDGNKPSLNTDIQKLYWDRFINPEEISSCSMPELVQNSKSLFFEVMFDLSKNENINRFFSNLKIDGMNLWDTLFLTQPSNISNSFHLDIAKFKVLEIYCKTNRIDNIYLEIKDKSLLMKIIQIIKRSSSLKHIKLHYKYRTFLSGIILWYVNKILEPLRLLILLPVKISFYITRGIFSAPHLNKDDQITKIIVGYAKKPTKADPKGVKNLDTYWPGLNDLIRESDSHEVVSILFNSKYIFANKSFSDKHEILYVRLINSVNFRFILKNYFKIFSKYYSIKKIIRGESYSNHKLDVLPILEKEITKTFLGSTYLEFLIDTSFWKHFMDTRPKLKKIYYLLEGQAWEHIVNNYAHMSESVIQTYGVMHSFTSVTDSRIYNLGNLFSGNSDPFLNHRTTPNLVIVNGETQRKFCNELGIPNARLLILESLRYRRTNQSDSTATKISFFSSIDIWEFKQIHNMYLNFIDSYSSEALFIPHPGSTLQEELLNTKFDLLSILKDSKIMICSASTSMPFHALINNIPLIIISNPRIFHFFPASLEEKIIYCNNYKELTVHISKILINSHSIPSNLDILIDDSLKKWKAHLNLVIN